MAIIRKTMFAVLASVAMLTAGTTFTTMPAQASNHHYSDGYYQSNCRWERFREWNAYRYRWVWVRKWIYR
jgi:hypothetical protein